MKLLFIGGILLLLIIIIIYFAHKSEKKGCNSNADCPSPQVCVSGQCITSSSGCHVNSDCPPPQVCASGMCTTPSNGCVSDSECTSPQVCVSGQCVTPEECSPPCTSSQVCISGTCQNKNPNVSCYQWRAWTPLSQRSVPSWAIGASRNGMIVPVGAQGKKANEWYLGSVIGDPSIIGYGTFFTPEGKPSVENTFYALEATGKCPTTLSETEDTTAALHFHGVPVCWDFTEETSTFTPYLNNACMQYGTVNYSLVADEYD